MDKTTRMPASTRQQQERTMLMDDGADSSSSSTMFHASYDLQREWNMYCARALGMNPVDDYLTTRTTAKDDKPFIQVVNLMLTPATRDDRPPSNNSDHKDDWFSTALQINSSLDEMANLVRTQRRDYARVDFVFDESHMSEEERSVLETTVLSYCATTANQIESLSRKSEKQAHQAGIVACLFQKLQHNVADPFAKLQKERAKNAAVAILKEPYRCEYVADSKPPTQPDELDVILEGPPPDHKFLPQQPSQPHGPSIVHAYEQTKDVAQELERPKSHLLSILQERRRKKQKTAHGASTPTMLPPNAAKTPHVHPPRDSKVAEGKGPSWNTNDSAAVAATHDEQLEHESALLLAQVHSDLEGVHKVEQTMTEITSLLTQFSNLISQQQEEILAIHEDAVQSKANVGKGQDSLLEAKRRTKQSKHYMASLIAFLALILLFFNWITP